MTDFSKIGKRSRRKGGDYERKICKLLTESTNVKFRRAPRSGALMREGKVNGSWISGDLTSEKNFIFSIECKNRKNIDLNAVIKNPTTCEWSQSWFQCVYDANKGEKLPLMFFYLSSIRKDYVAIDQNGFDILFRLIKAKPAMHICGLVGDFKCKIDNEIQTMDSLPDAWIFSSDDLTNFKDDNKSGLSELFKE